MSSKRELYGHLNPASALAVSGLGHRQPIDASPDPIVRSRIFVTLDQLQPYDRNPRRGPHPAYSDLKESIRTRGLEQPPPITRRPGAPHYMICNGGNTRLAILAELYADTKESRFFDIECDFVPWERESKVLSAHLIENDVRGDISFIDRALALRDLHGIVAAEDGVDLSDVGIREFCRRVAAQGYPISPSYVSRLWQALDLLYPYLPEAFHSGLGKHQVARLLSLRAALRGAWQARGLSEAQFAVAFSHALSSTDSPRWSVDAAQTLLLRALSAQIDTPYGILLLEVESRLNGKTPALETTQAATTATETNETSAQPLPTETPSACPASNTVASSQQQKEQKDDRHDALAIDHVALSALDALMQACEQLPSDVDVLRELLAGKAHCFASLISDSQHWITATPGEGIGFVVLPPDKDFRCDAVKARSEVYWFLFSLAADAHATRESTNAYALPFPDPALPIISATNIFTTAEWDTHTTASALAMTAIARRIRHLLHWK